MTPTNEILKAKAYHTQCDAHIRTQDTIIHRLESEMAMAPVSDPSVEELTKTLIEGHRRLRQMLIRQRDDVASYLSENDATA